MLDIILRSGITDPTFAPGLNFPRNTVYFKTDSSDIYVKLDDGLSTNWSLQGIAASESLGGEVLLKSNNFSGSTPSDIKDALDRMASVLVALNSNLPIP